MAETTWPDRFETILRGHLPMLPADAPLAPDADLLALGMDSMETVSVLLELEDGFAVSFPDELLTRETFGTATRLWQAVDSLRASRE